MIKCLSPGFGKVQSNTVSIPNKQGNGNGKTVCFRTLALATSPIPEQTETSQSVGSVRSRVPFASPKACRPLGLTVRPHLTRQAQYIPHGGALRHWKEPHNRARETRREPQSVSDQRAEKSIREEQVVGGNVMKRMRHTVLCLTLSPTTRSSRIHFFS